MIESFSFTGFKKIELVKMGPLPRKCHVCNEAQSKYKCPTCLAP